MVLDPVQIVRAIDPRAELLRTWPLSGGISSRNDCARDCVARRADEAADRATAVGLGRSSAVRTRRADEFRSAAAYCAPPDCPTSVPVHLDESGPDPFFVIEYIDGATDFSPSDLSSYIAQLASHLAAIHRVERYRACVSQLHARHRAEAVVLPPGADATLGVARICEALARAHPLPARNGIKLLHGDYWPGNVLWKDGRLVGVIDWEDTQSGDPIADLAVSRLDVLWAFGERAMHEFTARYQAIASIDLTDLPYWDLVTALRPVFNLAEWASGWDKFGRPDVNEATMRAGHRVFVEQAFAALSA